MIDYLCKRPEYMKTVAGWIHDEFVPEHRKGPKELDRVEDHLNKCSSESFPIVFILVENEQCTGTVSLVENDLKTQTVLSPWLASLYVDADHRGQGTGEKLIKKVEQKAWELGYNSIYLRTEHTADYYRKKGWRFVGKAEDEKGRQTEIFRKNLT